MPRYLIKATKHNITSVLVNKGTSRNNPALKELKKEGFKEVFSKSKKKAELKILPKRFILGKVISNRPFRRK